VPLFQQAVIYGAARQLVWRPTPQEAMFVNRMRWQN